MLEIKPFSEWSQATTAAAEPTEKVRQYADYLRTNYYKAGELNDTTEAEIADGIQQRAEMDGLVTADQPQEERQAVFDSLLKPKADADVDARFLLDHYRYSDTTPEANEKATTLQRYLTMKQVAPERIGEVQGLVDGYVGDRDAVKRARISAVDRGDYQVVAVDEQDGRQLYTGSNATPDTVNSNIESLVRSGAIAPADLKDVRKLMDPVNGGRSTVAEANRFAIFADTVQSLSKTDPSLNDLISDRARIEREQKVQALRSTGEKVFEGVKNVVGGTIAAVTDTLLNPFLPDQQNPNIPQYGTVGDHLANNEALNKTFSPAEIAKFSDALVARTAGPAYRADKPETGIESDAMGNVLISPQLAPNKAQFEKSLAASSLNPEQKEVAVIRRAQMLEEQAPKFKKLILGESDDAVAAYAQAKRDGKSDAQFVEDWVGNNEQNYDGMSERLQQFGMSTFSALATLPVGVAALAGFEPAAQALVSMNKEQTDREEYAQLFGDEFGLGFQLVNTLPQVATDILATVGTSGAYAGAKTLIKGGTRTLVKGAEKTLLREAAMGAVSTLDDITAATVREAATAGGEAMTSKALKDVSTGLAARLSPTEQMIPLFATSSLRSSSAAYGSIYGQLPEDMGHEEKHKVAFGYAIAAGISTGVITVGMSLGGFGGLEDLATGRVRALTAAESTAPLAGKIPIDKLNYKQAKMLFESVKNEGKLVKDVEFQKAMRAGVGNAFKNYLRTTLKGGLSESFEESIDQAVQIKLEDAALDRKTPLADKINQIWSAGLIGGLLGAGTPAISQVAQPLSFSDATEAMSGRATVLSNIASSLRKSGSNATAEIVERKMMEAKSAADASRQREIGMQNVKAERAKTELTVDSEEKPLKVPVPATATVAPATATVAPETATLTPEPANVVPEGADMRKPITFLGDLEGEKVFAHNRYGTISLDEDGAVRLNFLKPDAMGNTSLTLGSRFRNADGVISKFPEIMVTSQAVGDATTGSRIPAGTPYIEVSKNKFALPFATEGKPAEAILIPHIDENGTVVRLDVKDAVSLTDQSVRMDLRITSPYQIRAIAQHYNVDLSQSAPTAVEPTEVDAEGNLVEAEVLDLKDAADQVENPQSKEALLRAYAVTSANPKSFALIKAIMKGNIANKSFKNIADQLSPAELSEIADTAEALSTFGLNDPDAPAEARRLVGEFADELGSRAGAVNQIKITRAQRQAVAATPPAPNEVVVPEAEVAPTPEAEVAPETTSESEKKKRAAKVTPAKVTPAKVTPQKVITSEGNVVVEDKTPKELATEIRKQLFEVQDYATVVTEAGKISMNEALKQRAYFSEMLEISRANNGIDGITRFSSAIDELDAAIKKGNQAIKSRGKRLLEKLKVLTTPEDLGIDTETGLSSLEQDLADTNSKIEATRPAPAPAPPVPQKPKRRVHETKGEDWSGPNERNQFANGSEEAVFNKLVERGYITNLPDYGSSLQGIESDATYEMGGKSFPVFTPARAVGDPTNRNKYIKGKHILMRERVFSMFPRVELEEIKNGTVKSQGNYVNYEVDKPRGKIDLPVLRDKSGDVTEGRFTNDPIITLAQIKHPMEIFIPKDIIDRHKDIKDTFKINPTIDFDEATGRVRSVEDALTREPVMYSGEASYVNSRGYVPLRAGKVQAVLVDMIPPDGRTLVNAGRTATGSEPIMGRGFPVSKYLNDFNTYFAGNDKVSGKGEKLLMGNFFTGSGFGLSQNSVDEARIHIFAEYTQNLYEFALATKIQNAALASAMFSKKGGLLPQVEALANKIGWTVEQLREQPNLLKGQLNVTPQSLASMSGLNKLVIEAFHSNDATSVARSIATLNPDIKGGSPDAVISDYAKKLFTRISTPEGDLYTGLPRPERVVDRYGDLFQRRERRVGERQTQSGWGIGEEGISKLDSLIFNGKLNEDALDPMFLITRTESAFDEPETGARYKIGLRGALLDSITASPELETALRNIASLYDMNLRGLSGERLLDSLSNVMSNGTSASDVADRNRAMAIVNRLYAGENPAGIRAAGIMAEMGWLPPVMSYSAVPPIDTSNVPLKSVEASESELREFISKAKDRAYKAQATTSPEAEAEYRRKMTEGVRAAQPQIQAILTEVNEFQRQIILNNRFADNTQEFVSKLESGELTRDGAIEKIKEQRDQSIRSIEKLSKLLEGSDTEIAYSAELVQGLESEIAKLSKAKSKKKIEANLPKLEEYTRSLNLALKANKDAVSTVNLRKQALSINENLRDKYAQQLEMFGSLTEEQIIANLNREAATATRKADSGRLAVSRKKADGRVIATEGVPKESYKDLIKQIKEQADRAAEAGNAELAESLRTGKPVQRVTKAVDPWQELGGIKSNYGSDSTHDHLARFMLRDAMDSQPSLYQSLNILSADMADAARIANTEQMNKLGIQNGDPQSAIAAIRMISKGKLEQHREVANLLLTNPEFLSSVNLSIVDVNTDWAGLYDRESNTILINLAASNGRGFEDVLLHEYLHAATVNFLNNPQTPAQKAAVNRITQIRNLALARAEARGMLNDLNLSYGLSSNAEFLTATLTMPEFQSALNALTPMDQRSLLRRMVDAILSMFGKENPKLNNAVKELVDFTEMSLAGFHTYNIDGSRDFRALATKQEYGKADAMDGIINADLFNRIANGEQDGVFMSKAEPAVEPMTDPVEAARLMLPSDYAVEIDDKHNTAISVSKGVVKMNPALVKDVVAGLTPFGQRAVLRSTIDVALARSVATDAFTNEDLATIAEAAGPDILNSMANTLYESNYPDATERKLRIAADRLSGELTDIALAQEMVLGEMHQMALGNARPERMIGIADDAKVLNRFLQAFRAFINHLKDRYAIMPTTSTAAKISLASREFRRLRNNGVLPAPEAGLEGEIGDTGSFLNAIDNTEVEGQEDRTKFDLVIAASKNPDTVTKFWNTVGNKLKLTNMPLQLKEIIDTRDGTLSQIQFSMERFFSAFPALRDEALADGADIDTISKVLGTTAPMVSQEARKAIANELRQYRKSIKGDALIESKIANQERTLYEIEANRYAADFRVEQKDAEDSLRASGYGKLVDTMVEAREEMNRYKVKIGFSETNDVYLTRTYRYFNTPAWMAAAKSGLVHTDAEGNTVDFGKLRHTAAMAMYSQLVQDNAKETGVTLTEEAMEEQVLKMLDEKLLELDERAAESKVMGGISTLRRDLNLLKTKKDIDAPLRELLGEVKDPLENAVRTLYNVGRLAANNKFLSDFQRNAIALGIASETETEGMEPLFNEKKDPELGKLSALYVRSDIAAALREQFGPKGREMKAGATTAIENIGRGISYFGGLTIFAKTSLSIGYWPRNVIGGIALSTAQGIPPLTGASMKALRLAWAANLEEGKLNKTERTDRDMIRRLTELQIFRDETRGRIASDMMKGFVSGTDEQLDDALKTVLEAQLTGNVSKLAKFGIKFDKFQDVAGQLNNLVDSMFKAHAYFYELENLKSSYGESVPIEQLEAKAARKVKLTFPTHSQQLDITKAFNRSPYALVVMPFLRWKTEVARTMVNTPMLAYQELTSGNAGEVKRGAQRLIGYGVTTGAGTAIAAKAFATLFAAIGGAGEGDDKDRDLTDEEIAQLRVGLPNWQRNHSISARIVGGKMQIIDITNILPYSQFTDIAGIMAEGIRTGKGINPKELASYFSGELIGTTIAAKTISEAMLNRDDFGKPIALADDDAATASYKLLKHLTKGTIAPASILKGMQAFRTGEKDTQDILIGEVTGARPNMHEYSEVIRRGFFALKDSQEQAVSILRPIRSGKKLDNNDIPDILEDHQNAMNKVQGRLAGLVNTMKGIGATNADIFAAAKTAGFSQDTVISAMNNRRITWRPNSEFFSKMSSDIKRLGEDDFNARAKAILDSKANEPDYYRVNP